jgi:disulfide bond formation protein DsbB
MIQEQIQSTMLSFKGDCSMVLCQVSFSLVFFLLVYFFALFMIMFLMVKINFDILRIL